MDISDECDFKPNNKDKEFFDFIKKICNKTLTKEQMRAVLYNDGHHVVMSTAGSGKTSVLCIKLAYLILEKKISPSKVVVVSFSKNSALDIEKRFKLWFGNVINANISFSTIHSFAYKIIRDYERKKGFKYTVIEDNKTYNKKLILSGLYKKYNKEKINEDQLKELEGFITFVRNKMIYIEEIKKLEDKFPVPNFIKIYEEYSKLLINKHFLDYDTLLVMAHLILTQNIDILRKYQNIYSYYLVDESQDNSKIQNEIIKLLVQKGITCYVGDSDQRIYSWRGADERFSNFESLYPGANILFMDQNFRSTSSIVNLANRFIKCNHNRYDKDIYTENEEGEKVRVLSLQDEKEQLDIIIKSIKEDARPYSNYSILYRNNISAIAVAERLNKEKIPFCIKDEISSFFKNFIVNDVINFIRFAINPSDLTSFKQIYYKTMSYIPKKALETVPEGNNDINILEEIISSDCLQKSSICACKLLKENFIRIGKERPSSILNIIQNDMNYYNYLERYSKENNYSMEGMDNIISALQSIFESLTDIREVEGKLRSLKELIRSSVNNKEEAVNLSTFHSSKGLEWDTTFIIDTYMIPTRSSVKKREEGVYDEFEEEMRTFFVAITRPKKKLIILQPRTKNHQLIKGSEFFNFCLDYISGFSKLKDLKMEQLHEGMSIYHNTFGAAFIHKIYSDGFGEIVLEGGELKKISFNICINKKLIKQL